jgi:hypothetical protein
MRQATLRKFCREKLDVGWSDISDRVARQLREEAKDDLIQNSWDLALQLAAEIAEVVIEEVSPLHKIPKYMKKLMEIVGVKKANTEPGGTDDMLTLLGQLRKENQLFHELDKAYRKSMDEIGGFTNPPAAGVPAV